jgi:hypothetical protein
MGSQAMVAPIALSTALLAGAAAAAPPGIDAAKGCREVVKLEGTQPFTKAERKRISTAARRIKRVLDDRGMKVATRLAKAKTDKVRAAVLTNTYEYCVAAGWTSRESLSPTSTRPPPPTRPPTPTIGTPVTGTNGTITVYGLEFPVVGSSSAEWIKTPGTSFAVADVEVCPQIGPVRVLELDFRVTTSDNRQWENFNTQVGARDPRFGGDELPAGLCRRGWITFEVGDGSTVTGIVYEGGNHWNGASPISENGIVWQL